MASIADPDHTKSDFCSNPTRKVRVIAKIRGFTDKETESCNGSSKPWISVHKHNEGGSTEKVTISFGDQQPGRKYVYDMDYCYEQNEDFGLIFSREIRPLVSGVIDGQNASVIAYGARGSGKTYTIQGSEEKPGLATLAMTEILSMAEAVGKYITVSFYEVFQDHVYDLLDSNRPEVQVFENAQGKVALKGLSQVSIKSIPEFHKLYYSSGYSSCKPAEKIALPRRSHKGLMIHMLSYDENSNTKAVSKMNFVDLAGYEDTRGNRTDSTNLGDTTKINRSLYALMNVIHALNTNEIRVPYRESKLTRVLQDSIGGTNRVLMLTCLNPSFCQDTMYTACLASRSFQGINQVADSTKRSISKSAAKSMVLSSLKNGKPATISAPMKKEASVIKKEITGMTKESAMKKETSTMKKEASRIKKEVNGMMKEVSATKKETSTKKKEASGMKKEASGMMKATKSIKKETSTMKKETNSRVCFHDKISGVMVNGRKLFDDGTPLTTSKQAKSIVDASLPIICKEEGILLPTANEMAESTSMVEKENSTSPDYNALETSFLDKAISPDIESNHTEATPGVDIDFKALTLSEEADTIEKENKSYLIDEGKSPPLSARLRELSNNLKFLCSSTPSSDQVAFTNALEPKTPLIGQNLRANDKWELARFNSPWETFNNRSSGMKNSLVHDTLQFLNSASKDKLKGLKGIGEKRATYILELREESPEPFKNLDDLQDIGLSAKQIKGLMKNVAGELFS